VSVDLNLRRLPLVGCAKRKTRKDALRIDRTPGVLESVCRQLSSFVSKMKMHIADEFTAILTFNSTLIRQDKFHCSKLYQVSLGSTSLSGVSSLKHLFLGTIRGAEGRDIDSSDTHICVVLNGRVL